MSDETKAAGISRKTGGDPEREAGGGTAAGADRAIGSDRDERIQEMARRMEDEGWTGSPLVVHGDQVLGGLERYEAARFAGMENEVPRITLTEVFEEAGMDMPQIASEEGGTEPGREMFEDYLRDLPRHISDKYEL